MQPSLRTPGGFKVDKLGGFECAQRLKKGSMIVQKLSDCRLLAPEIQKKAPHDFSADIWSVGQIIYQLVTVETEELFKVLSPNEKAYWQNGISDDAKAVITAMTKKHLSINFVMITLQKLDEIKSSFKRLEFLITPYNYAHTYLGSENTIKDECIADETAYSLLDFLGNLGGLLNALKLIAA